MDGSATFQDAFNLLCGKKLGSGIHRDVFECRLRPDLVVKVEIEEPLRYFANVMEHNFYMNYCNDKNIVKWLAPIRFVSPDQRILLQDKVERISDDQLPKKLPAFLTDIKRENFGILNGRVVCVDYVTTICNPSTRLRNVHWY